MAKLQQDFETYNTDQPDLFYVVNDGQVPPNPVNLGGASASWQLARDRGDDALFVKTSSNSEITFTTDDLGNLTNAVVSTAGVFTGLDGVYFYTMVVTQSGKPITVVEGSILVRQGVVVP